MRESRRLDFKWPRGLAPARPTCRHGGNVQLNRVFADAQLAEAAYIEISTSTTGRAFAAYGSVLDNQSSDPTTVLPQ